MLKKKILLILACMLVMSCAYFDRLSSPMKQTDESLDVEAVSSDDKEINAAIARAQETLPVFIDQLENPISTYTNSMIKVRFPYDAKGSAEHMWMGNLSYSDSRFTGVLGDKPIQVKDIHQGDTLTIDAKDVTDWVLIKEDGTMLGGFTMHVFISRMTQEEANEYIKETGFKVPDEPLLP